MNELKLSMKISVSDNNSTFTEVASANNSIRTGVKNGNWETLTLTAVLDQKVSARYVKFTVNSTATNNFVWLDEVEVMSGDPLLSGHIYINGINQKIGSGDCFIFTPAFGTITVDTANHAWTANVVAKWDEVKYGYVVTQRSFGEGSTTPSVTLASDEIFIASNNWETGVTDGSEVKGSAANTNTVNAIQVGDVVRLDGIDVFANTIAAASYVKVETTVVPPVQNECTHVAGPENCTSDQVCLSCGVVLAPAKGHDDGKWEVEENIKYRKCTKCGEVLETQAIVDPDPVDKGDIDNNGAFNSMDYILLKRAYFDIYTMENPDAGDIDANGGMNSMDYVLLKRVYFGIYQMTNGADEAAYQEVVEDWQAQESDTVIIGGAWTYDLNDDGNRELVVQISDNEGRSTYYFYAYENDAAVKIGEKYGDYSTIETDGANLYICCTDADLNVAYKITYENGTFLTKSQEYDGEKLPYVGTDVDNPLKAF